MLIPADEFTYHQVPLTFAQVGTSDHRFYDRYWFSAYSPDGDVAVLAGMGRYVNMNVLDGYVAVRVADHQHNTRFSRQLDDEPSATVGGLSVDIVEPLKTVHVGMESPTAPVAIDLTWQGKLAPIEGPEHFRRAGARVVHDSRVYYQFAEVSGAITVGGRRVCADSWFGYRDHSWGVRPGVGGFEPFTTVPGRVHGGALLLHLVFDAGESVGYMQFHEDGDANPVLLHGAIYNTGSPGDCDDVVGLRHDFDFEPETRTYSRGTLRVDTRSGRSISIALHRMGAPWAYVGTGYDGGYSDGRGLGAFRGGLLEESDTYDVSHPEDVVLPSGERIRPIHRETFALADVDGCPGAAHLCLLVLGDHARYFPQTVDTTRGARG